MTRYEVVVTPEAEAGIEGAFQCINDRSPANAAKWLRELHKQIYALETMPGRCSLAREKEFFEDTLRQIVFKSHRIIFRIEEAGKIVRVLYGAPRETTHGRRVTSYKPAVSFTACR